MSAPNIYLPYPIPQSDAEIKADINTLIFQPGVPQELQDQWTNLNNSPEVQADINQAEANSDSMADE